MTHYLDNLAFEVTCLQAGQPRPYADSCYQFEIETLADEQTTRRFCVETLCPCRQTYAQWSKSNTASYFAGYYTFQKIDTHKYRYTVVKPFCD